MWSRRSSCRAASSTSSFVERIAVAVLLLAVPGVAGAKDDGAEAAPRLPVSLSVTLRDAQAWIGRQGGIEVYDVSVPARPVALESVRLRADVMAMAFLGDGALLAGGSRGLYVVDVADLESPSLVSRFEQSGRVRDVLVVGDQVWLASDRDGLVVVDLRDRLHPLRGANVSTTGEAIAFAREGNHVALAEGQAGVRLFDASRPASPRIEGVVRDAEGALDVAFAEKHLVVAAGKRGLLVYSLEPKPLARPLVLPPVERAVAVTVADGRAIVLDRTAGIQIVELAPDGPHEVAFAPLPRNHTGEQIVYRDGIAYVAAGERGMVMFDLSQPTEPKLLFPADRKIRVRFE